MSERNRDHRIIRSPRDQNLEIYHSFEVKKMRELLGNMIAASTITGTSDQLDSYVDILNSLQYVQYDTYCELKEATKVTEKFQDQCWNDPNFISRAIVFTLISNTFNRSDTLLEYINDRNGTLLDEDITEKVWHKGVSGFTRRDKKLQRISPERQVVLAANFAQEIGLPTRAWPGKIETILQSHAQSLGMLRAFLKGNQPYTVQEAMMVRRCTVGVYARLLGDILAVKGYHHRNNSNEIVLMFAKIQSFDDRYDINQDISNQINPFVAKLVEAGLLEAFLADTRLTDKVTRIVEFLAVKFAVFFSHHPEMKESFHQIARDYEDSWLAIA